jgi:hypothetical protein
MSRVSGPRSGIDLNFARSESTGKLIRNRTRAGADVASGAAGVPAYKHGIVRPGRRTPLPPGLTPGPGVIVGHQS